MNGPTLDGFLAGVGEGRSGRARQGLSVALIVSVLSLAACQHLDPEISDPDFNPDIPGPGSWPAFHADRANRGALFIATDFAIEPKWSRNVGPVLYSSPVVGGTGRVYLGDLNGRLYAVNPFGNLSWMLDFNGVAGSPPAMINSSPAVSDNGVVYAVVTEVIDEEEYRSTLHVVGPDGVVIRSNRLPDGGYTTASPKIWRHAGEDTVFLYVRHGFDRSSLMVFNKFGERIADEFMGCNTPLGGSSSVWGAIGDFLEVVHDAFLDGDLGVSFDAGTAQPALHEGFGWLDPTVAIVDEPSVTGGRQPFVVLLDQACFFKMFRWDGSDLAEVWSSPHQFLRQSSPTVLAASETIVTGGEDGRIRGYDLSTGQERWSNDLDLGPVMGTPASLGGSVVQVAAERGIATIDAADGTTLRSRPFLGRTVASPVLSGSHVYATTTEGLISFSVDFRDFFHAHGGGGGLATPAIGGDGTVYTVAAGEGGSRLLHAYGGAPFTLPEVGDPSGILGP